MLFLGYVQCAVFTNNACHYRKEVRDEYQRKERERLNEWKRSQGNVMDSPVVKSDALATNVTSMPNPDEDDDDDDDDEERLVEYDLLIPQVFFEVHN